MIEEKRRRCTTERSVTVRVSPNIALIKYWGKSDETEMIPLNDSVSLSIDCLYAETSVSAVSGSGREDSVCVNGSSMTVSGRFVSVFQEVRRRVGNEWFFHVHSTTNFPVAAGLASSAAGFGAIAFAIGELFALSTDEVASLARRGSGSACRSVLGGLVHWRKSDEEGKSSVKQLFPSTHWPQLRAVILVAKRDSKSVSSKEGMQRTVDTSRLLQERVRRTPERVDKLRAAFGVRDFSALGELIMRDSNELHAVCMDTFPPLKYMNEVSWRVVEMINSFNADSLKAAYTFDAGPNACVYVEEGNLAALLAFISRHFHLPSDGPPSPSSTLPSILEVITSTVGGPPVVVNSP